MKKIVLLGVFVSAITFAMDLEQYQWLYGQAAKNNKNAQRELDAFSECIRYARKVLINRNLKKVLHSWGADQQGVEKILGTNFIDECVARDIHDPLILRAIITTAFSWRDNYKVIQEFNESMVAAGNDWLQAVFHHIKNHAVWVFGAYDKDGNRLDSPSDSESDDPTEMLKDFPLLNESLC